MGVVGGSSRLTEIAPIRTYNSVVPFIFHQTEFSSLLIKDSNL